MASALVSMVGGAKAGAGAGCADGEHEAAAVSVDDGVVAVAVAISIACSARSTASATVSGTATSGSGNRSTVTGLVLELIGAGDAACVVGISNGAAGGASDMTTVGSLGAEALMSGASSVPFGHTTRNSPDGNATASESSATVLADPADQSA